MKKFRKGRLDKADNKPKLSLQDRVIASLKKVLLGIVIIISVVVIGLVVIVAQNHKLVYDIHQYINSQISSTINKWSITLHNKLRLKNYLGNKKDGHRANSNGSGSILQDFGGNSKNHQNEYESEQSSYNPEDEQTVRVVKNVLPGVVSIALDRTDLAYGAMFVDKQAKIGSGFVIDSQKGIIVTNRHVVEAVKGETYKVILQDGTSLSIIKVLEDPVNDIAFVFVNPGNVKLHSLALGDSNNLALGEHVIAIGTPFGEFPSTVTSGIISGLHRKVTAPSDWGEKIYSNVIQTDAAINPGNSGGPLINLAGQVIGVNFAKINGADNISFALPINLVKARLAQYEKYGRFRQAFLGVSVRELGLAAASYYGVPAGALVLRVVPNSPAYKAGIKSRDIIVSVNNQAVYKVGLINILSQFSVGDKISIHIKRPVLNNDGYGYKFKDVNVNVQLGDRYDYIVPTR